MWMLNALNTLTRFQMTVGLIYLAPASTKKLKKPFQCHLIELFSFLHVTVVLCILLTL